MPEFPLFPTATIVLTRILIYFITTSFSYHVNLVLKDTVLTLDPRHAFACAKKLEFLHIALVDQKNSVFHSCSI